MARSVSLRHRVPGQSLRYWKVNSSNWSWLSSLDRRMESSRRPRDAYAARFLDAPNACTLKFSPSIVVVVEIRMDQFGFLSSSLCKRRFFAAIVGRALNSDVLSYCTWGKALTGWCTRSVVELFARKAHGDSLSYYTASSSATLGRSPGTIAVQEAWLSSLYVSSVLFSPGCCVR